MLAGLALVGTIGTAMAVVYGKNRDLSAAVDRAERERDRADEQRKRAEWLVYAGKLSLAQSAFQEGNSALAVQYLHECQWDLRGWEHRYLWTRFNSKQTLTGHSQPASL